MFKNYQSKPITRKAAVITHKNLIKKSKNSVGKRYALELEDGTIVPFAVHQTPVVGDYVVYLNDNDVYHCTKEVFEDRNIVE